MGAQAPMQQAAQGQASSLRLASSQPRQGGASNPFALSATGGMPGMGVRPGGGSGPGAGQMVGDFMQRFNPQSAAARPSFPIGGGPQPSPGGQPTTPAPPMSAAPADPFSRPTSAMDVYRSSVPVMQDAMKTAVGGAMADAGFTGNRFGSYAMDRAAQEGSRAGLQQNQLLTSLLHDQTNRDQDRSLQAAGLGMQHGISENQMQLDRMKFLADQGRWEQGRQDQYGMLGYQDFENNKLGFLQMLAQMAQSPGTATAPTWGTQQTAGSPGFFDYAKLAAQIYGAYQGGQG